MKHFLRAVKLSLRYRWSIAGAVLCSMIVAVLWTGSITTILPVVQSVFEKKTFVQWVDEEIIETTRKRNEIQTQIDDLKLQVKTTYEPNRPDMEAQIADHQSSLDDKQKTLDWYAWIRPYIVKYSPADPFGTLVAAMSWLIIATTVKGVFLVLGSLLVARVANATVMDLRRIYYRKALEMDQIRIDRMGTSNMMTHLSHNMQMVSSGLLMFYGKAIREPMKMLACLSVAAFISWKLLLMSLFVIPFGAMVIHRVARSMKNATTREMQGMADVFDTLIETFSSIKTVRIFNQEHAERRRFKHNASILYRISVRMKFYDSLLRPLSELLGIISVAVSILIGAYLVINEETSIIGIQILSTQLTTAKLMLFYAMLAGASDPARKMSEILNVLVRAGTACEGLSRCYDEIEAKVVAPENPTALPVHSREIEFQNVFFAYDAHQPVVKGFSTKIPFGQTLAIVGENGCGKSTLVNLLARLYDPHVGRILLDGIDIKQVHPKKLRRQIAWVTQDSTLFQGTVWENISYGKRNPTDAEIHAAIELAQIDKFKDALANGYQTEVGEGGGNLSAGQRQRVILGRAIVADPRIFILDEATSQMDGHTEQLVHNALQPFIKARTTIIITHRFSSIKLASRVIVMREGEIVSDCTPGEAIESSSQFQHLFAAKGGSRGHEEAA